MRMRFTGLVAATTLFLGACTSEQVIENSGDAVMMAGKLAVNTTIGAGKLAYRGAKGTYSAVRDARNPEGEPFPPGTFLCTVGDGVFVEAKRREDGSFTCEGV